MKFLAIDTSGARLAVVACNGDTVVKLCGEECAQKHSVLLMEKIETALKGAKLRAQDCDFFACVVGPGSFTGIRIGIATVKGLGFACGKRVLGITSFEAAAYAERGRKRVIVIDAGHGNGYACVYDESDQAETPPAFLSGEEIELLVGRGYAPVRAESADLAEGLYLACKEHRARAGGTEELAALYLRKSSAEEKR